ncbi:MAG: recombinase RecA [Candidatus Nanopelagicaceae bacterium]|nr:recombinase RecA [Candidatus Nanopelagicaceae bacterium]
MKKDQKHPKDLENLIERLNKDCGTGAIMLGMQGVKMDVEVIPTGAISLDFALGVGGIPRGRVTEIFGHEGCGKTTLCLHIIANAQKAGGNAAFIDVEHAVDLTYAKEIGVQLNDLVFSQPDNGEQALNLVEGLVKSNIVDVIVVDSAAALVTKEELDGEVGDRTIGATAKLIGKSLRRITTVLSGSRTALVFINQTRVKIGAFFGDPDDTPGGKALKFFSTIRMKMNKVQSIREGEKVVGNLVAVKVIKNKVAPPFRGARFDIRFGKGISYVGSLIDMSVDYHIITKSGAFLNFNELKLGNGKAAACAFLSENPNISEEIKGKLFAKFQESGVEEVAESKESDDNG